MADGAGSPSQLRNTYDRFSGVVPEENILVVTLSRFADQALKVIPSLPRENLLLEPFARKKQMCSCRKTSSKPAWTWGACGAI